MLAIGVNLGENGPKATWLFVVTEAGIDDECVRPVAARIVNKWFWAEMSLEFKKGLKGIERKLAAFPWALFFC